MITALPARLLPLMSHDARPQPPAIRTRVGHPPLRAYPVRQVLVVAMGGTGHRRNRACYRGGVASNSASPRPASLHRRGGGCRPRCGSRGRPMHSSPRFSEPWAEIRRGARSLPASVPPHAANSPSTTLPGGPVLSATFLPVSNASGASTVAASWQLVAPGVAGGGLGIARLGGAFLLGAKNNPFTVVHPKASSLRLLLAQAVASCNGVIEGSAQRVLSWANCGRFGRWPTEVARDARRAAGIGRLGRRPAWRSVGRCSTGRRSSVSPRTPPATIPRSVGWRSPPPRGRQPYC